MGNVTKDWEDPGRVPPHCGPPAGEDSAMEGHDRQVGLPTTGRGDGRSGDGGGVDVRPLPPEYCHPEYCHSANTGAMSGGIAMGRSTGDDEMAGAGRPQLRAGGDGYGDKDGDGGEKGGQIGQHRRGGGKDSRGG